MPVGLAVQPRVSLSISADTSRPEKDSKRGRADEHQTKKDEMFTDRQKKMIIPVHPATADLLGEEDDRVVAGAVVHKKPMDAMVVFGVLVGRWQEGVVFLPDGRHEPLAARITYGNVGEKPIVVERDQRHGQPVEERVVGP